MVFGLHPVASTYGQRPAGRGFFLLDSPGGDGERGAAFVRWQRKGELAKGKEKRCERGRRREEIV